MGAPEGFSARRAGKPASLKQDAFEYGHRIPGLLDTLRECGRPFVIAVEGEWGRGKSSFLRMLESRLLLDHDFREARVAHYDPWRYNIREFDDAWESIVDVISKAINDKTLEDRLDDLRRAVQATRAWRGFSNAMSTAVSLVPPVSRVVGKSTKDGGARSTYSRRHAGSGFMLFEEIRSQLAQLVKARAIFLFIDDLDRCEPAVVDHVLRCLPTLFAPTDDGPNVVVVLALDRPATARSLKRATGRTANDARQLLEKIINLHVTLPIVGIGAGNKKRSIGLLRAAVRNGSAGRRSIRNDQIDVIARFMQFNPRRLERFCVLFDLKWQSRFDANRSARRSASSGRTSLRRAQQIADFRNRLIWESIVELCWPEYDAKVSDLEKNKAAIMAAVRGEKVDASGLPCEGYLQYPMFLEIHRLYEDWQVKDGVVRKSTSVNSGD